MKNTAPFTLAFILEKCPCHAPESLKRNPADHELCLTRRQTLHHAGGFPNHCIFIFLLIYNKTNHLENQPNISLPSRVTYSACKRRLFRAAINRTNLSSVQRALLAEVLEAASLLLFSSRLALLFAETTSPSLSR